jgi:hypothetical protein
MYDLYMPNINCYEESDTLFNVIVNSEYATYNFLINAQDVPVIQDCHVLDRGDDEPINYEFKSQAHAWVLFNNKVKIHVH